MSDNGAGLKLTEPVLASCEAWLASLPKAGGVPVARAMTYDLVQLLNRIGLRTEPEQPSD